jgi:hypothetical protein
LYPELDEAIMAALSNPVNEDPKFLIGGSTVMEILKQYKIFYYRDMEAPEAQNHNSINIMNAGDTLRADQKDFDGSPRQVGYVLVIIVPNLQYLDTLKAMRDCTKAIKIELETNPTFTPWSEFMELGDVRPAYDDRGVFKEQQMQLLFNIYENYYEDDDSEITQILIRGDLS